MSDFDPIQARSGQALKTELPGGYELYYTVTTTDASKPVRAGRNAGFNKAVTYWIQEAAAPTGYVLPEDAWFGPLTVTASDTAVAPATIAIGNTQQSVPNLPMTGASGQLLMTIAGIALILVAGGGALAVRNRSKSAE